MDDSLIYRRIGIRTFADSGLMAGNVFSFFDTPPVPVGYRWHIDRLALIFANGALDIDPGIGGVFLCPKGTQQASVTGATLTGAQVQAWLPILVTETTNADKNVTKMTVMQGGISSPIIVPGTWFLRAALQNTGGGAWPAGTFALLNLLMAEIEDCQ